MSEFLLIMKLCHENFQFDNEKYKYRMIKVYVNGSMSMTRGSKIVTALSDGNGKIYHYES